MKRDLLVGLVFTDVVRSQVLPGVAHMMQEVARAVLLLGGAEVDAETPEEERRIVFGAVFGRQSADQREAAATLELIL